MRFTYVQAALALGLLAIACSQSPTVPSVASVRAGSDSIMIRVTNTSDSAIYIGGFPDLNPPEPQPSGGIIGLGMAPPGVSCFALPDSIVVHFNAGTPDAHAIVWRAVSDGIEITGAGYTQDFVAGSASGWNITVPGNNTTPLPAEPCTR
jgi:hypothetical protein